MRFFPKQDPRYPHDVLDVDFLANQLPLAVNNGLKSLENQTNKNFKIIFLMNPICFSDKKYEFIFSTLKEATTLPVKFMQWGEYKHTIRKDLRVFDFVIQSRMDFDDFVYKDGIADTQNKVAECENILYYGYCKGYSYINGDILPYFESFNGVGHHSILQSLILKCSFAKNLPLFVLYQGGHHLAKTDLQKFLAKSNVEFSENMFQQNTTDNAFIYYRHELAHYILTKHKLNLTVKSQQENALTTEKITKKYLEDEFGFTLKLNSIE